MKTTRYIPILGVAAAGVLLMTSCVKDTLYDTPHPSQVVLCIYMEGTADDEYVANIDGKVVEMMDCLIYGPTC